MMKQIMSSKKKKKKARNTQKSPKNNRKELIFSCMLAQRFEKKLGSQVGFYVYETFFSSKSHLRKKGRKQNNNKLCW